MKPQKLVRKYRFLKPHEKIRYGDWMNGTKKPCDIIDGVSTHCRGWIQVQNLSNYAIGMTVKAYCPRGDCTFMYFARFVDCIPARPQKPKTVRTENTK